MAEPAKKSSTPSAAKKSSARKTSARKTSAKTTSAKKAPAKTTSAKKAPAKKAPAKKTSAKTTSAKTTAAQKATASKRTERKAARAPESRFFQRAVSRARKVVDDPDALRSIADRANTSGNGRTGPFTAVVEDFRTLVRLVVAYARGHYREIPADQLAVVVGGLIYVASPLDLIPDTIPGVGLLDDAYVVGYVVKTVREELDAFREWEQGASDTP